MKKLSTKEFIKRAIQVHGGKFDYSSVNYGGSLRKISIKCHQHGLFKQLPSNHLVGSECPKCAYDKRIKLDRDKFIEEAKKIHGTFYDYSRVKYKTSHDKVEIVCKVHGSFLQEAREHLKGSKCKKCSGLFPVDFNTFIKKAKKIYGHRFQYFEQTFKGLNYKTEIKCPKHGIFSQTAWGHLRSRHGCPKCGWRNLDTLEFIRRAKEVHGEKYNYSEVVYQQSFKKVKIICAIHGKFRVSAHHHLDGKGCQKCSAESGAKKQAYSTEEFIRRAKVVHGESYDYSLINYKTGKLIIPIVCPVHGTFKQRAGTHLEGQGCPSCQRSKGERKIELWLIKNKIKYVPQKKFKTCRGKKYPLRFDFYLPKQNTCIEFDGDHHFKPWSFGKSEKKTIEDFKTSAVYDKRKNSYCLNHGIAIFRPTRYSLAAFLKDTLPKVVARKRV